MAASLFRFLTPLEFEDDDKNHHAYLLHRGLLIEVHGGPIWVESRIGMRTTFYFTVPSLKVEE